MSAELAHSNHSSGPLSNAAMRAGQLALSLSFERINEAFSQKRISAAGLIGFDCTGQYANANQKLLLAADHARAI